LVKDNDSYAKEVVVQDWLENFGGSRYEIFNDVIESSDGNFIVVGYTGSEELVANLGFTFGGELDGIIAKYNKEGKPIWITPITGSKTDNLISVIELTDGNFVAVGHSNSSNLGFDYTNTSDSSYDKHDFIICKFSENGQLIWIKNYSTGHPVILRGAIKTSNEDIVCIGFGRRLHSSTSDAANLLIVKFDKNGNMLWSRNWGGNNNEDPVTNTIVETSEGDYIVATYTNSGNISGITNKGGQDIGVVKYSSSGDLLWQKSYGGSGDDAPGHSIKVNDNEIYIVGSSTSTDFGFSNKGESDAIIMSVDIKTGDLNWIKNFGGLKGDVFKAIVKLSDDNFACIGYSYSTDWFYENKGNADIIFVKFDKEFNVLLTYSYGGSGTEEGRRIIETSNKEIVISGYSNSTDAGFNNNGADDAILMKLRIVDPEIPKSTENITQLYLIPNNVLELSLSTASIIFENFSILEPCEKLNAVELKISSSMAYNIDVSLESSIIGQSGGTVLENSTINIKSNNESTYKSFSDAITNISLAQNQPKGNDVVFGVDIKIADNKVTLFDVYKTVLKFEVAQI
jgi:hypothetical protein